MKKVPVLKTLYDHLSKDRQIVGLTKEDNRYFYRALDSFDQWQSNVLLGNFSPKEVFFPQDEVLFYFKAQKTILPKDEVKPNVLWGVRPCDIAGIGELERMFNQVGEEGYKDPYFMQRFERTLIVGLACSEPWPSCFCTSVEGSPYKSEGADIFIYPTEDGYLIETPSKKGEAAIQGLDVEEVGDVSQLEADRRRAEDKIEKYNFEGIADKLKLMVDSNFWDRVHNPCIGCGTCAFVCPSCHCFDVSDASRGSRGLRSRQWDSCLYEGYTLETSGHNPRPSGRERWRQRLMHKFSYFPQVFGSYQCLGCGRCGRACPVNINIAELAAKAVEWEEASAE
ncbi:MAG: 4Fe-4S ferredoxin [Candidatus Stahlbacteria bacterium]|nr:MAG: 4Fe-4S ferredoxin [Candidatus Stahlbacteria bacterium]